MRKIALLVLITSISFASCKSKYPNLEKGVYAEFVTNKGTFLAKFYNDAAPLTVANFVELANGTHPMVDSIYKGKPFFNGLTFHRVIKDFMIQGGDPNGDGRGNPGYKFPDEFADTLKHTKKGLLSMANSGPGTNGSQFFITLKETPWLDNKHSIFGEIVKGQEVVDSIGMVATTKPGDKPVDPVIIQEVNIINNGIKPLSFESQMEAIELKNKEKAERLAQVAAATTKEWEAMQGNIEELPSGLKMYWNQKGKGIKPEDGSKVQLHYQGYLNDGTLFGTSQQEIAEKYDAVDQRMLAAGQYIPIETEYSKEAKLIPGFREGVLQMSVGDTATLFIPSHLGYGEQGAGNVIPPNSDLVFVITLVGIK